MIEIEGCGGLGQAEWIAARGVHTERGFEIWDIEGPDEGIGRVNNSNYVQLGAMMVLERAIYVHDTVLPSWVRVVCQL